ncbi:MAG: rhodanese-like domain-containing protein [Microthrixaceae bacterium]
MSRSRHRAGALLAVTCTMALGACSSDGVDLPDAAAGEVTVLTSEQGRELMGEAGILVVDVRSVDEYRSGHLVGAQSIDALDEDAWEFRTTVLDPDRPTVVYCSDSACSDAAAQRLVDAGFSAVYDLGGMDGWDPEFLAVEAPSTHQPLESSVDDPEG